MKYGFSTTEYFPFSSLIYSKNNQISYALNVAKSLSYQTQFLIHKLSAKDFVRLKGFLLLVDLEINNYYNLILTAAQETQSEQNQEFLFVICSKRRPNFICPIFLFHGQKIFAMTHPRKNFNTLLNFNYLKSEIQYAVLIPIKRSSNIVAYVFQQQKLRYQI